MSGTDRKSNSSSRKATLTGRFKTSTAHQKPVDIDLPGEILAVLLADRSSVDDSSFIGRLLGDCLGQPFSDGGVDFLGLLLKARISSQSRGKSLGR